MCDAYRNKAMAKAMEDAGRPQPSFAERQIQQQKAAQQNSRRDETEKKRLREANAKLAAEVAALKAKNGQPPGDGDEDEDTDEGDDDSYSSWTEESRAKRVELAKGGLAYAVEKYGEDSVQAAELRQEIATVQKASRQAKPFKAHRAQLERRRERLQKQQERDEGDIAKAEAEVVELQTKMENLRAAVEERARAIKEVTSELKELVQKSIAEGSDETADDAPPGSQDESPWGKMSSAIRSLETMPGIPPELATLLARVQEAAVAMAAISSPTTTTATYHDGANGAAKSDKGQQAAAAPATPNSVAAGPPTILAPHGRFGRNAAKAGAPSPPRAKPAQPPNANDTDGGGQRGDEGGGDAGAPGAGTGAPSDGEAKGGAAAVSDSGSELLEDDPMQVELESSLAKLPEGDQKKLRAALERSRGRGKGSGRAETEEDNTRRGERERSPRPTKGVEDREL
jgi:hypothetical protein